MDFFYFLLNATIAVLDSATVTVLDALFESGF
jgi:hypothetical protein